MRLEKSGYEVTSAVSGEEALRSLKKDIPDLILLDLLLPGIQGEEVCKKLKCDDRSFFASLTSSRLHNYF